MRESIESCLIALVQMLFRELRIWSSLDHPNVLPLLGLCFAWEIPSVGIGMDAQWDNEEVFGG